MSRPSPPRGSKRGGSFLLRRVGSYPGLPTRERFRSGWEVIAVRFKRWKDISGPAIASFHGVRVGRWSLGLLTYRQAPYRPIHAYPHTPLALQLATGRAPYRPRHTGTGWPDEVMSDATS